MVTTASVSQNGNRETYEPTTAIRSLADPFDSTGVEIDVVNLHSPSEVGLVTSEVPVVLIENDGELGSIRLLTAGRVTRLD